MATILRFSERKFVEDPGKVDHFRLFSDVSRKTKGIQPENLNFDLRILNPGQFSAPYHFHRNAEELFLVISGTLTLRTPAGLEIVEAGDLMFFEKGEAGAHQFFNHGEEPCIYLDIRTFIGYDICEYPDSEKILFAPSHEIYRKGQKIGLFDGEDRVQEIWENLRKKAE